MWNVATTENFDEWFAAIGGTAQAEVIAKIELLKLLGPQLGRPHADTLKGSKHSNMKELRADTADKVMRIAFAFAFDPERQAILLVAGNKAGVAQKRFYNQLIGKADELFADHLARIEAKRKKQGE